MSKMVLVVDDEKDIRTSLCGILEDEGYRVTTASGGIEALECIRHDMPDLVLLDIWMPGIDGLETLEKIKESFPQVTVIMISGHGTIETAVRATKLGAFDFIEKPLSLDKILIAVANALQLGALRVENEELRRSAGFECELIGESPSVAGLRERIVRVAPTAASVLIRGEHGTGKELVAHSLHYHSQRCRKPFIVLNCAAIPEQLIDNELFGYEKGAFAGAVAQHKGKVDLADGGTLLIDEICDMPLTTQARILRLLKEGCFERVGGKRCLNADVRVAATTRKALEDEVRGGHVLEELMYQLDVVPFLIPPLRERKEDIPALVAHFASQFGRREGREPKRFAPDALELFEQYDWPGNVRELKNMVERIVIMISSTMVSADDVAVLLGDVVAVGAQGAASGNSPAPGTLREAREEFERDFIIQKLEENDWNISRTAEIIELERSNLHRKIKSYGIDVKK